MRALLRASFALVSIALMAVGGLALGPASKASPAQAAEEDSDILDATCPLQTYGAHQYYTCAIGHPAETALAASPTGRVWALHYLRPQYSDNGGQTWTAVSLTPPNVAAGIYPEGDVIVAPNGDVLLTWLTPTVAHTAPVWVSTNGGTSFTFRPLTGAAPVADRPWIMTSALTPADPANPVQPNPYAIAVEAGAGVKPRYGSGDRGNAWYPIVQPSAGVPTVPFPTGLTNNYLDFAKPMGQGFPASYVALGDGQILDIRSKRMSYDLIHWTNVANGFTTWPSTTSFPWWDSASDGTLYAEQNVPVGGVRTVKYKWFDGTWHDGATSVALTAEPDYLIGLTPIHVVNAAVKSFGTTLGINTREGTQDVLIRITDANTASAAATKELIGTGSGARYDYPNLVFDSQGRAVTTLKGNTVAYATTV